MVVKTAEILKFLSEAKAVKSNPEATINGIIKLSCRNGAISMYKTNLNLFCHYEFDDDMQNSTSESFLINEKSLSAVANTTTNDLIEIRQIENSIVIGEDAEIISYPKITAAYFPEWPIITEDAIALDQEVIFCIKVAAAHVKRDTPQTVMSFVHVRADGILGSNGNNLIYHQKIAGLPTMFLSDAAVALLKPISGVMYKSHSQYDYFEMNGVGFAIVKPTFTSTPNMNLDKAFGQPAEMCFTIHRQVLLNFCTLVNQHAKVILPTGSMSFDGNRLVLRHEDRSNSINISWKVPCLGVGANFDKFNFSIHWLETLVKSLPYDRLTWSIMGKHFKLTSPDDENYLGLFAGMS